MRHIKNNKMIFEQNSRNEERRKPAKQTAENPRSSETCLLRNPMKREKGKKRVSRKM